MPKITEGSRPDNVPVRLPCLEIAGHNEGYVRLFPPPSPPLPAATYAACAERAHIGNFDHMNACAARPALCMVDRFTQTLDQVFAELVQKIASMPLRRITLSSTSAGPVGRLAPRSS